MSAAGKPRIGRRAAFAIAAYAFAVTMLGTPLPTPLYVFYQAEFGFSTLMVTVIFATYAVGVIAALLLFGRLSDEVGRRRVLLPGLALSALSAVAFLLAQGLAPLLLGRLLSGLSAGIFTGTATATLLDLADPENRARATLVATVANMGGLGCGPLLAGAIAEWSDAPLKAPFWVALALLLPAVAGVWAMPEPGAPRAHPRLRPQGLSVPPEIRAIFVRAAMAGFAGFAVLGLFTAVGPAFAGQVLGVENHAVVGLIVFSVFAASTCGQLALGPLVPAHRALPLGCAALIAGMAAFAAGLPAAAPRRRPRRRLRPGPQLPGRARRNQRGRPGGPPRRGRLQLLRRRLRGDLDPGRRRGPALAADRPARRRPRLRRGGRGTGRDGAGAAGSRRGCPRRNMIYS